MKRRCGQNWGVLKTSPVDRGPQGAERTIDGRNLVAMAILCLEAEDLARLLQGGYRHVAKRSLCRLEPPVDRSRAAKSLCFDVVGVVAVEELRDAQAHGGVLCRRRHPRIASSHNLAQEPRFPDAFGGLLGCDRLRGSARQREFVDRHAPPLTLVHHIEPPGMLTTWARSTPFLLADLSNSHSLLLSCATLSSVRRA